MLTKNITLEHERGHLSGTSPLTGMVSHRLQDSDAGHKYDVEPILEEVSANNCLQTFQPIWNSEKLWGAAFPENNEGQYWMKLIEALHVRGADPEELLKQLKRIPKEDGVQLTYEAAEDIASMIHEPVLNH